MEQIPLLLVRISRISLTLFLIQQHQEQSVW